MPQENTALIALIARMEAQKAKEIAALQELIERLEARLLEQQGQIIGLEKGQDAICASLEALLVPSDISTGSIN